MKTMGTGTSRFSLYRLVGDKKILRKPKRRGARSAVAAFAAVAMLLSVMPTFAQVDATACALTDGCKLSAEHEGGCCVSDYAWYSADAVSYTVDTAGELFGLAAIVNGSADGIGADSFSGKTVTLAGSIDLMGALWTPIGTTGSKFCGTFDGSGYQITGLNVNVGHNGAGLFGVVGGGAHIKNLTVSGSVKTTGKYAGGIVGNSGGSGRVIIENCGNHADVTTGGANAAGIIGCNDASAASFTIKNCYNVGTITGSLESAAICAWLGNNATVENCWNIGSVTGISGGKVFARYGSAAFTNCFQFDELYKQEYTGITNLSYSGSKEEALRSGQIAGLLGTPWGQTVGADNVPVIGGPTVYSGYTDNCKTVYSNSSDGLSAQRPAHDTAYEVQQAQCGVCGEWHPESIMYKGLDLTQKTEDASGTGWTWTAATKTLALTNCTISSSAEAAIKLPDGATIRLSGENSVASSYGAAKTIYALGSLTICGSEGDKLSVIAAGGHVIFCENASSDVLLSVEDATLNTSGGEIELPQTNKNSSVEIRNSVINTNEKRFKVISGADSAAMHFVMENSSYVGEKLYIADAERQIDDKMTVSIFASNIKPTQTSGNNIDSAFNITARDLDLNIANSYLYIWTKGWTSQNGNSYAMRLDASGNADIDISDSDFVTYGASTGFYIDVCGDISAQSAIEDSTIVSYAKNNPGDVHVWDNDSDNNGWANDDRRDIFKDCVLLEYSYMSGKKHSNGGDITPYGAATVIGSPVLTHDFILPESIGLDIKLASVTPELKIGAGNSLTIAEGNHVELPDGMTLVLSADNSLAGSYVGRMEAAEGVALVILDLGDQVNYVTTSENGIVIEPAAPTGTACRSFGGWYADKACTIAFDFTQTITADVTVYAKWSYSHVWGEWEKQDDVCHIRTCKNDINHTEQAAHIGGTANCKEKTVCTVCSQPYGTTDGNNHVGTINWVAQNETQHKSEYDCCGAAVVSSEDHQWEVGVCTKCNYRCTHTGRTEIRGRVEAEEFKDGYTGDTYCLGCQQKVKSGEPIPMTHVHTYSAEWKSDTTKHWHECACGAKADETAHTYENGKCTACGIADADCKAPSAPTAHVHAYSLEWKSDTTKHWHECACGAKADETAHTYENGKCTACGIADADCKAPSNTPQTGNNSNMALWFALLFVSGSCLFGSLLIWKKRI